MNEMEDRLEDEIELMDYLRVMWQWKYLIVIGTLICVVAAAVMSFMTPKIYRLDMVIVPGRVEIRRSGQDVYVESPENIKGLVESPENIKGLIEAGALNTEILTSIGESNSNARPSLKFSVNILKNGNTVRVSYETSDVERGSRILNRLCELLLKKGAERVAFFQNEYETEINLKQIELARLQAERQTSEWHIQNLQKRIDALRPELESVRKSISSLIQERDKFLSGSTNERNTIAAVLYANTIQQSIAIENSYRLEMNDYISRQELDKLRIEKTDFDEKFLLEKIDQLTLKKDGIQNIQIVQPPTSSPYPIKPRIKHNVMLAAVVGFFVMLLLAFFLEYVQRHRAEPKT